MAVTLTEKAANHVQSFLSRRGKGVGLRLGVRTSGCSGMAYKLEFADTSNPDDVQFESHGVKLLIDPKSLPYLEGTELDAERASTSSPQSTAGGIGRISHRST